ncbi:hypothetical protein QBC34DRAFT_380151 [Podospora aff. communis PSN243]|uniref:Uncharacterized protein n=1 Tax=Podospora aff. communis PSN243 TaxID=3040156 RepID=A0AAV9GNZ8_9PEZI|nr:hypothetical protein QBC34DRAFT_380151 [Podospora aff. communis PSN243]
MKATTVIQFIVALGLGAVHSTLGAPAANTDKAAALQKRGWALTCDSGYSGCLGSTYCNAQGQPRGGSDDCLAHCKCVETFGCDIFAGC